MYGTPGRLFGLKKSILAFSGYDEVRVGRRKNKQKKALRDLVSHPRNFSCQAALKRATNRCAALGKDDLVEVPYLELLAPFLLSKTKQKQKKKTTNLHR